MKNTLILRFILLFTASLFIISCEDDDPLTPEEEHLDAIGMVLYDSGIEYARILRGETADTLVISEGAMTSHMDVKFIDENENIIDAPETEHHTLSWEIENPEIAAIWQHEGEEGSFEIHLQGLKKGETKIEFFVMHEGHADYRSGKFPIRIDSKDENAHGAPVGYNLIDEESGNTLLTLSENGVTGSLSVNLNEITEHIEVEFFDSYNVTFQPAVPPHSLLVESSNTDILGITGLSATEPWAFKLEGKSAGSTNLTIKIMHDGAIGKEFPPINVNVN
jgi:hypothetical protein